MLGGFDKVQQIVKFRPRLPRVSPLDALAWFAILAALVAFFLTHH